MITSRYRTALLKRHEDGPDTITHAGHTVKSAKKLDEEERAVYDAQPTITRCAVCDWVFVGTAAEGRNAFLKHAKTKHRRTRRDRGNP